MIDNIGRQEDSWFILSPNFALTEEGKKMENSQWLWVQPRDVRAPNVKLPLRREAGSELYKAFEQT